MEKTFGVKDFVLFTVLMLLCVLVVLAMVQFDRQWDEVQNVKQKLEQQASDLRTIQRSLDRGAGIQGPTTGPSVAGALPPALERIEIARGQPSFAEGDWLVDGLGTKISSLTPFIGGDAYSSDIVANVQEGLCTRDPVTLEWQGLLAESWTIDDNSAAWNAYADRRRAVALTDAEVRAEPLFPKDKPADQQAYVDARLKEGRTDDDIGREADAPPAATFTFKLRRGPMFSDGRPVTADDVVFTFNWMMNPLVDMPRLRAYYSRIREVKKTADGGVAFVFRVPYFESMSLAGGFSVMPRHFYEKYTPQQFNQSTGLLLGSGPYRMEDPTGWTPGKPIELVRNARYWGVSPGFDKLVVREFTNPVALETSFRNREIDRMVCRPEQYVQLTKDKDILERTQHYDYQSAAGGYRFIAWNQVRQGKPTKFADKRVRQAMTLLIDQGRMIGDIMLNLAVPATGPFNPASKQNDPDVKPYAYDPTRAMKLLADAGWEDRDNRGILTNAAGEPFEFKLTFPSGNPNYEKMALLLKDLFARAKVKLNVDPQEFSVFGDRLKHRNFDAISLAWSAGIETDIFQMFHSSQMADGGDDFMSYRNPELDATIEQARKSLDEPARMKLWQKAHRILHEDQPYTFLFFPKSLLFMDDRIANVQRLPLGLNADSEWYVPKTLQRWTK